MKKKDTYFPSKASVAHNRIQCINVALQEIFENMLNVYFYCFRTACKHFFSDDYITNVTI